MVDLVLALPQCPSPDRSHTFHRLSSSNSCASFLGQYKISLQLCSEPRTTGVDWKFGTGFQSSGCGYVTCDTNLLKYPLYRDTMPIIERFHCILNYYHYGCIIISLCHDHPHSLALSPGPLFQHFKGWERVEKLGLREPDGDEVTLSDFWLLAICQ